MRPATEPDRPALPTLRLAAELAPERTPLSAAAIAERRTFARPEQRAARPLPAALRVMAFRNDWTDWGIARRMLPPNSHEEVIGNWTLRSGVVEAKKP